MHFEGFGKGGQVFDVCIVIQQILQRVLHTVGAAFAEHRTFSGNLWAGEGCVDHTLISMCREPRATTDIVLSRILCMVCEEFDLFQSGFISRHG